MKISRCNGNIILDEFNVDLKWQKIRTIAQSNILESIYTNKSRLGKTKQKVCFLLPAHAHLVLLLQITAFFFSLGFFSKIKIKSSILWKTFEKIWKIFTGIWFLVSITINSSAFRHFKFIKYVLCKRNCIWNVGKNHEISLQCLNRNKKIKKRISDLSFLNCNWKQTFF